MPKLKAKLLPLFQTVWQRGTLPPSDIQNMELELAVQVLQSLAAKPHAVSCAPLSIEKIHRHIMVIACPDQAFYPDAIRAYLHKQSLQPLQQHSILYDSTCWTQPLQAEKGLLLVFHFAAATLPSIKAVHRSIEHVLLGVQHSVADFPDMLGCLENIAAHMVEDAPKDAKLLRWMLDDHYLLFGLFNAQYPRRNKGVCSNKRLLSSIIPQAYDELLSIQTHPDIGLQWLHLGALFSHLYSRTNVRAVQLTWVEQGKLCRLIVLGHFSRGARYTNTSQLPVFNDTWSKMVKDNVLQQSAFYQREMRLLFDRAPKSLVHAVDGKQWLLPFKSMVDLHSPTQMVVQRLTPKYGNIEYIMIALSQHRFGDKIWANMQASLADLGVSVVGFEGYVVGTTRLTFAAVSVQTWPHSRQLYHALHQCIIFWVDKAKQALLDADIPTTMLPDALRTLSLTSRLYQDIFPPEQFVQDVRQQQTVEQGKVVVRLQLLPHDAGQQVEVQVLSQDTMPLAWMTEKLNAFALVTMEQALVPFGQDEHIIHICKFRCEAPKQLHHEGLPRLRQGIEDVLNQSADHDALNALIILCGLGVQDVLVMIALRNHLAQLMMEVSVGALSQVLIKYRGVSLALFRMFEGKHRAAMPTTYWAQAEVDFEHEMVAVQSLKEDTWLRALAELVASSVRCNAWVKSKTDAIAIKIDTSCLSFAPYPKPYREIFVHGVFVEGIHLRAGKIARGGLRYSDRPTDFRTEVLELMATQVVKNGQIVPTGAKGGFVIRETKDVLGQYHQFIHALLSITDNRVLGKLQPPEGVNVSSQDTDDAYLVVAADKGTAKYSDDANEEALNAHFWLGDAFASGGSYGYDHKAYGITARGAWVCAAHHFAKWGVDLWQDEVSVVGIGDMGGDVFGNGMLLNPNMKLIAAFNHQHIFLDPNPDGLAAFAERQRLFAAVKAWADYDVDVISSGGGVFSRTSKRIILTPEVQQTLGITQDKLSGEALIRAILQAPVDLLYNGGIGTYIKASHETDADAQDPANNAVRIDARSLRCQVLSEGGNLGLTQSARLEYAKQGGYINTDAIDNAAGVNMSDHEVNLKILLADLPFNTRNKWLRKVAEDVSCQCLDDNQAQAIALSLSEATAKIHLPRLQHLQQCLYDEGYIQYMLEEDRFTFRPVYAEWLGHEKNRIHQALDDDGFYRRSVFGSLFVQQYFPKSLRKPFADNIANHALGADIAHTRLTSHIINRYGITAVQYLQNLTALPISHIVQALLLADNLLNTEQLYQHVFAEGDDAVADWYVVQQDVLSFAEGLLALPDIMGVDAAWLQRTRTTLAHDMTSQGQGIAYLVPLVTAVTLANDMEKPLRLCLKVTAQCLTVLPFTALENVLRTPLWASDEAHALRREWLGRLRLLKVYAAREMLALSVKKRVALLQAWESHSLQQALRSLLPKDAEVQKIPLEQLRLRYILALTHLQSIVECDCHLKT
ncbi:MAG: NAD-glutamate dehydrogenase [Ghiorsea sp.]|nr:NAD-glutamate dehydrogenase [Ghiorsea sp.]